MDDKTLVDVLEDNISDISGKSMFWGALVRKAIDKLNGQADTIEAQATRIEALEAALRFYARENSWKSCGVYMCGHSQPSSAEIDRGNKARAALEGSGNG